MSSECPKTRWGASYRLVAAQKWRAKSAAMGRAVTEALVEYAAPGQGMNVLDVASGTGEPAISVAKSVGPLGQVTALDLSADLLAIADERARAHGLANFSTRPGDVHQLPFPVEHFDLATCRFGVMFFADCDRALRELYRVLKPGARACFAAWGPFEQPYWSSTVAIVHRHVGGPLLAPDSVGMFRFAQSGQLSQHLRCAGFIPEESRRTLPWSWPGPPEELWAYIRSVSVPFRPLLDRVPQGKWVEIENEIQRMIRDYYDGSSVNFSADIVLASGKKT